MNSVKEVDKGNNRPFITSSPSNGLESISEDYITTNSQDPLYEYINIMNQNQNIHNSSYPPTEGYQPYPVQQPFGYVPYPTQQPVDFMPYPTQQPAGYIPCPTQSGVGCSQNEIPIQPPPVLPRPDFAKDGEQGEGGQWGNFTGLESKEIRRVFIRKVYSILMIQLAMTFGLIALFLFTPSIYQYVRSPSGQWLYFTSYVVFMVTYFVLVCCKSAGRKFPLNLILLGILTLSMGYMMGMISAHYEVESVLIAVGITIVVCLGVTLFSFQTKYDFTSCFGILFIMSLALFAFGIVCIFTYSR
ncbi:unnamed protein product, partial [Rotaria sp. Silwood2]